MAIEQGFMIDEAMEFDESAEFAASREFDFVELNMEYTFERRRVDPSRIRQITDRYGLDVVVHLPYRLDPGSPHEHVRDGACRELEAAIDTAIAFGADRGVFHATSSVDPETWDGMKLRECIYETVRRIDKYARERGFEACVENLIDPIFDASCFPELFDRTEAAGCLDTGHAFATGQKAGTQAKLLREHGSRISHLHLNETRREDDDEHLPIGFGKIDFSTLASAIRNTGWEGTCTHEIHLFDLESRKLGKVTFDRLLSSTTDM
jgi:sugar phosphate isomerase/epimerase